MTVYYEKLGRPLMEVCNSCSLIKSVFASEAIETFQFSKENIFSMSEIVKELKKDCDYLDNQCEELRIRLNRLSNLLSPIGLIPEQISSLNTKEILIKVNFE